MAPYSISVTCRPLPPPCRRSSSRSYCATPATYRAALLRLSLLTACCCLAMGAAFFLQHADPDAAVTRAFLIAVTARLSLLLNQNADLVRQLLQHRHPAEQQSPTFPPNSAGQPEEQNNKKKREEH